MPARRKVPVTAAEARAQALASMSESEWQKQIVELAYLRGWVVAHFRPARTEKGWRTAVSADGAGWPDLVLVKKGRLIVAEVKSEHGALSPAQKDWLALLATVPGIHVYVWKPRDWELITKVLGC